MNKLKEQLKFVKLLTWNLFNSFDQHIQNVENQDPDRPAWDLGKNWMDKNCGKTALKRKITTLRQELLNLERMLGNG